VARVARLRAQIGGPVRVSRLLRELSDHARRSGVKAPFTANTPYINTISAEEQPPFPAAARSNAASRAWCAGTRWPWWSRRTRRKKASAGHISTYASAATLYEVGFNHFFKGKGDDNDGDIIYFQGHAAPGIYSRAFLEGRLSAEKLENFRRELKAAGGLSSYPHPWLMPDFWEFPTVSMGLGPICAIYQARFMHYLEDRGLKKHSNSKVWAFLGDGETDEPESLGAITLASREKLDNLIFVINCNLQRLDGPVRGNGQIIQELEAVFRGAGWNVIKVIWGGEWDSLLAKDSRRRAREAHGRGGGRRVSEVRRRIGAYVRQHFWGADPRLLEMVAHLSDEQLKKLTLGGHDPAKVYAGLQGRRSSTPGSPRSSWPAPSRATASAKRAREEHHPPAEEAERRRAARLPHRFGIPVADEEVSKAPFYRPSDNSPEVTYLTERRKQLGGFVPFAHRPGRSAQARLASPSSSRNSTPAAKAQGLHDDGLRPHAREAAARQGAWRARGADRARRARTFGMEALFRQVGIYSRVGQLYEPVDMDTLLYYKEAKEGQISKRGSTRRARCRRSSPRAARTPRTA
jgi:pyruvate dehydrogenase E1 component